MLIYDAQLPVLDDSFAGDEVALLAVRDGKVDRAFRRNYAWAKHAANTGKLSKITVVVEVSGTDWIHTVGAVQSALTGAILHDSAVFDVRCTARDFAVANTARQVEQEISTWSAPVREWKPKPVVKPAPKPVTKEAVKPDVKAGEKVEDSGA